MKYIRWIVLSLLLAGIWCTMPSPDMGEAYARNVYPYISGALSCFSSLFSFSIGDCLIYGSMAGLLAYLVYAIVKKRSWRATAGRMIEYLLWIYVWFYLAWGLNYFRKDFFTRTEIPYAAYSVSPAGYLHPKPMLMPFLMSGVGVLGYMGPFFTEYNLNPDLLPVQYPFTYAHEMAHVLGISSEAEANLYGFLVCSRSGVPEIRFSAYFALLPYVLSNAYGLLSEEEFNEWKETISPEVKDLYNRKVAYWENLYSPFIGEIQSTVYNWFLKGNNIPSGRKNYSEVVALLMALGNTSGEI